MSAARTQHVILNGDLVRADEARIPGDDRGFLYGDSVFTTLRCYGGAPFRLDRHAARMNASLRSPVVGIPYKVDEATLRAGIARLVEINACPDAVVRFRVTRGRGAGPLAPANATPTTLLTAEPLCLDQSLYERGARLIVSSVRRDPHGELGKHKLGSYFSSLLARREAIAQNADEAIICDTDGHWLECASSNLFVVADGALITPDTTQNLLPGIARETVLECAEALGIPVSEERLTAELAEGGEEAFITNSVQEVVPVARIGTRSYTVPGSVTRRLMDEYGAVMRRALDG
jgi:branched-chain amino acid aminotransferase